MAINTGGMDAVATQGVTNTRVRGAGAGTWGLKAGAMGRSAPVTGA